MERAAIRRAARDGRDKWRIQGPQTRSKFGEQPRIMAKLTRDRVTCLADFLKHQRRHRRAFRIGGDSASSETKS